MLQYRLISVCSLFFLLVALIICPTAKALADDETVTNSDDVIAGVVANPQAAASVLIEAHTV